MKNLILMMIIVSASLFSNMGNAARAWVGNTSVSKIFYAKSNGNCKPGGGTCLMLTFSEGYQGCESISIQESDPHYKNIQSLALVSMTAGRRLSLYLSDEHCQNSELININNVVLQ